MPTSNTPDDTPAWIKGDLPADEPDPQETPAPGLAESHAPEAELENALAEMPESDAPDQSDLSELAAELADLEAESELNPEITEDEAGEDDDLLPDPQDSAPADTYDVSDEDDEDDDDDDDDEDDEDEEDEEYEEDEDDDTEAEVVAVLTEPELGAQAEAELAESQDWADPDDSTTEIEPDVIIELVVSEPAAAELLDSEELPGSAASASEPEVMVVLETFTPTADVIESPLARLNEAQPAPVSQAETPAPPELPTLEPLSLEALIESLLFVADGAVPIARLAEALEVPNRDIEAALTALGEDYRLRGLSLQRFRDKVQLTTSPSAAARVERFLGLAAATPLSRAALEALAIVAYQQPVTRPQIEAVRGVNSDSVIKNLLTKGLIEESGRAEGPGRPVLYSTTSEFMQHFGLASLGDLPPLSPPNPENAVNPEMILKG